MHHNLLNMMQYLNPDLTRRSPQIHVVKTFSCFYYLIEVSDPDFRHATEIQNTNLAIATPSARLLDFTALEDDQMGEVAATVSFGFDCVTLGLTLVMFLH